MPIKILLWQTDNSQAAQNAEQALSQLAPWACFAGFDILRGTVEQVEQYCQNEPYPLVLAVGEEISTALNTARAALPQARLIEVVRGTEINWDGSQLPRDWLQEPQLLRAFFCCVNPQRAGGVKYFLQPGSTIYYNTLYSGAGLGGKLDPCFAYLQNELGADRVLKAWAAIYSLSLMGLFEGSVELQFGADEEQIWATASFPLTSGHENEAAFHLLNRQELKLVSTLANAVDTRVIESSRLEVSVGFWKKSPEGLPSISLQRTESKEALEDEVYSAKFQFRHFQEAHRLQKTSLGFSKNEEKSIPGLNANADQMINDLRMQIEQLNHCIEQRDEMIEKLNKELADSKNPEKWHVLSSIQDSQREALTNSIDRLKQDVAFLEKEKKQLLALADQAVRTKDELQKITRDQETKLRQIQENYQTRSANFEKQIEDLNKQKKDLMKIITQLTEKIKAMTMKGAA